MKKITINLLIIFVLLPFLFSCEKILVGTEPTNSIESTFETFWQDMDKNFSFFPYRRIDWDSVYRINRPRVNAQTTDKELLTIFGDMISKFNVGHLDVYSSLGTVSGLPYIKIDNSKNVIQYIADVKRIGNNTIVYGSTKILSLGYIQINNFSDQASVFEQIDNILAELKNRKGIIIDIRNNGGGSLRSAASVAGRFFKETQLIGYIKYKNSSDRNDFTDWQRIEYPKVGNENYQGNIILLTSRYTFSAAEGFTKIMKNLPQVTIVGDTTRGSTGNRPITKPLPNGWAYRLPTAIDVDRNYQSNEGIGFAPNIFILNTPQSLAEGRDLMLEKAIEVLRNK